MERTFDRIPQWDVRNEAFRIRTLVGPLPPRSYTWRVGTWLDQGSEGACVGFAFAHELAARPKVVPVTNDDARSIYHDAQRVDDYPGEDYSGTSVLAGAKVLTGRGKFTSYRWAVTVDELVTAVGYSGPVVLGIDWHEGMMSTDSGWIYPTGSVVGGHAILCYSVSVKNHWFRLWNSWGRDWGDNGTARVSFLSMKQLLAENGEACVPQGRH
jgi:hypothetical protein